MTEESSWRYRHRTELAALRTSVLPWHSRTERETLNALEADEALLAIASAEMDDPRSSGLVALTNRRLIYSGGHLYEFYVMRTLGTLIAEFIARQKRVQKLVPLGSVRVLPAERGSIAIRSLHGTVFVRSAREAEQFASSVKAAVFTSVESVSQGKGSS